MNKIINSKDYKKFFLEIINKMKNCRHCLQKLTGIKLLDLFEYEFVERLKPFHKKGGFKNDTGM
jgi:hypothetical protein